jgi:hypothetical protein
MLSMGGKEEGFWSLQPWVDGRCWKMTPPWVCAYGEWDWGRMERLLGRALK